MPGRQKPIPFVIVADDAFAMKSYIMNPYPFKNQPGPNRVFNYRISRACRVVENTFGLISTRFRILRRSIELTPEKATIMITTICALHFFSSRNQECMHRAEHLISKIRWHIGNWRQEQNENANIFPSKPSMHRNYALTSKQIRGEFTKYFVSERGKVAI